MKGVSKVKKIENRKQYIGALKKCLLAKDDFKDLEYVADIVKNKEYLILSDIIGQIAMLDITGIDEADIFHTIAKIECGIAPRNIITDKAEKMHIAKLK